jgi:predicted metal-dependent hydrolase
MSETITIGDIEIALTRRVIKNVHLSVHPPSGRKDLLEYVIVHEMVHLLEPSHSQRFMEILDQQYPGGMKHALSSTNCR